jgi:hypothetical protein
MSVQGAFDLKHCIIILGDSIRQWIRFYRVFYQEN